MEISIAWTVNSVLGLLSSQFHQVVHWWGRGLKRNLIYLHNLHHLLEIGATEWF